MFKTCTVCAHQWGAREEFINDPSIGLVGYQANFVDLKLGLLLFNHLECGATLALEAYQFSDLHDGPIYSESRRGEEDCLGYCLSRENLSPCTAECECAWVRELIHKQWGAKIRHPGAVVKEDK